MRHAVSAGSLHERRHEVRWADVQSNNTGPDIVGEWEGRVRLSRHPKWRGGTKKTIRTKATATQKPKKKKCRNEFWLWMRSVFEWTTLLTVFRPRLVIYIVLMSSSAQRTHRNARSINRLGSRSKRLNFWSKKVSDLDLLRFDVVLDECRFFICWLFSMGFSKGFVRSRLWN